MMSLTCHNVTFSYWWEGGINTGNQSLSVIVHLDLQECNDVAKDIPYLEDAEECEEIFYDDCVEVTESIPGNPSPVLHSASIYILLR